MKKNLHLEEQRLKIYKPVQLIGASEVYYRNGNWYCSIGISEFMFLPTQDLSEFDILYDFKHDKIREFRTEEEKIFKWNVLEALQDKEEEIWISTNAASFSKRNGIQFISGRNPGLGDVNCFDIEKAIKAFYQNNKETRSELLKKSTYLLLLIRWLKNGNLSFDQIVLNSSEIGHYRDSQDRFHKPEKTGTREFAGLNDFIGNTSKLLKDSKSSSGYAVADGNCFTRNMALAHISEIFNGENKLNRISARAEIRNPITDAKKRA